MRRPPTSFIGRDDDVAGVIKRLRAERLVTLTGPGGVGKTRLATEVAAGLTVPAWFAELAPVTDPAEVPYAVLDALGLRERSIAPRGGDMAGDPVDRLAAALADRDAVLILDNCEHVIDAAAGLAARLLADCPKVRVLATSREPLQIPGETLHVVAPLRRAAWNPTSRRSPPPTRRCGSSPTAPPPSCPASSSSAANATAVASICRNLDGMPLAIELAAPWLRTLDPRPAGRAARRPLRAADRGQPDRAATAPDAARGRRLELGSLVGTGARPCPTPRRLPWRGDPHRGRARVRRAAGTGDAARSRQARCCPRWPGSSPSRCSPGQTPKATASPATGCWTPSAPTAWSGWPRPGEDAATRDASARYYLELAETADPQLRTKAQGRWFRVLTAEQDNVHAAIRWAVARQDADTALRFVRAMGYYWVQRGYGEADALCREVLGLTPPPLTLQLAEARVICALLAAGWSWDIERVREPLTEALDAVNGLGADYTSFHPLVAMAEPVLMQYDGASDQALQLFERYIASRDPWLRAIGKVYISNYALSLGRLDGAEERCRAGLAELRALGEQWGVAMALTMLVEFTELRADHAASVDALTEAAAIGREIGVWGDLGYVEARLGVVYARAGDLDRGYAEIGKARRVMGARGGEVDSDRWVTFMLAELASLAGDYAEAARCCEAVLAAIADNAAPWWESLRAQVKARLAVAVLRQGDPDRCARLLRESLDAAAVRLRASRPGRGR